MPPQHSTFAGQVDSLFYFILYAASVFFAIVVFGIIYFAVRYRRGHKKPAKPGPDHNTALEIIWTLIPTILVVIVFFRGFKIYLEMNVPPKDAMEIKVTGQKWFWSFDYPNGASTVNELDVPVGKPVKLLMSSRDVIHGFYIPDFRIKADVVPNRYTITWFQATQTGTFNLFCTQYCGKGHSEMIAKVKVMGEREYDEWLASGTKAGEGMSLADFGAKLYVSKACATCHNVDGTANVGPTFKGIFGHPVKLSDGSSVMVDENYIRESILNPQAKIVAGYQPVMPTFQGVLNDREVDALTAYIKTLK
ncbi:Cytochrome c oxidase subunit 2 [Candidatus Zixiibacteriota bacterium]|nr:Cytochrome c oxidase subunit 2 [candidate division Zixibacteria bacterium]